MIDYIKVIAELESRKAEIDTAIRVIKDLAGEQPDDSEGGVAE